MRGEKRKITWDISPLIQFCSVQFNSAQFNVLSAFCFFLFFFPLLSASHSHPLISSLACACRLISRTPDTYFKVLVSWGHFGG